MASESKDDHLNSAAIAAVAAETKRKMEEKNAKEKETCEKYVRNGLNRNVTVQFLYERLLQLGCKPPDNLIRCLDCKDSQRGGGFGAVEEIVVAAKGEHKKPNKDGACAQTKEEIDRLLEKQRDGGAKLRLVPEIYLCQQHLRNQTHAHEAMVHELIHAIDMCRTKMDPIKNCIHLACTEIRAENLSGECHWLREIQNGRLATAFVGHGAKCVTRRAVLSVKANPNCADKANEYVDAAFERCYKDTFPFDRHPNNR
mmetsp:Transcript_8576/g.18452  ORF Transcript_8576/g.18452 Transcript_8576/m.18452 type:complete len:256 (-) Transcript_8576:50-817(-)|eukprot:CAMPEP_0172535342 /NCGR_PEP_ID=MMETSP1067-20121228/7400_1 /TAXON_ID=265564 ORGANISM="Thalassiosira punctigera, Strain Tpunct2005C2" /NCGR_SAMPLE_ID=MMETSP1067 /ASSEMBLY_ACC=CAM_ASM_000444 /LENGTH=255 /DNA_ID=CAMNT_0013320273 /DNA_START=103 /DNA_END=870 /DNA_ORIENTATION=+